jgi:diacylglycerol kinase (ATP)
MKVLFLINPNAGGRGNRTAVDLARERFVRAGWDVVPEFTGSPAHAAGLISSAHADGFELLVVAGGDGTVHCAVQHIPLGTHDNPSTLPLGIIPLGSGNDFYRGTGAPFDPGGAALNIIEGGNVPVDIGIVEPLSSDGSVRDETPVRFINSAGAGIDSQTLATREKAPAFLSARYEILFLITLLTLKPLAVRLEADDWTIERELNMVLCCNNGWFGSGMRVAPDAKIDDGRFDVLIIDKMPKWKFAINLPKVFKGTHLEMDGVEIRPTTTLTIHCKPQQRVATDGDRAYATPVRIRLIPCGATLRTSCINGEKL